VFIEAGRIGSGRFAVHVGLLKVGSSRVAVHASGKGIGGVCCVQHLPPTRAY
jgi:hypothetical protein